MIILYKIIIYKEEIIMAKNDKKLEIVSGKNLDLKISPVYDHVSATKPKTKKQQPKDIVIPKETKKDTDK